MNTCGAVSAVYTPLTAVFKSALLALVNVLVNIFLFFNLIILQISKPILVKIDIII